jgi:hypothetical protein
MTIVDEIKHMDKYHCLEFVEFLEFIGRVAATLSPLDHKDKLIRKVEFVLQKILAVINERVRQPLNNIEIYSESDSEPYKN